MKKTLNLTWNTLNNLENIYGESFYLLDSEKFKKNYNEFLKSFRKIYPNSFIAYSYKTNYIPKLCKLVNQMGGYAEVVSEMEFNLAIKIGVTPKKIIYNGPYKSENSIKKCLLNGGMVNLDSLSEVDIIEKIAHKYPKINMSVGLRCNFDIGTPLISRFGLDINEFSEAFKRINKIRNINVKGIHCHFPNRSLETFISRIDKMLYLSKKFFKNSPEFIDIGGGYFGKMDLVLKKQFNCEIPSYQEYADIIATKIENAYKNINNSKKPKLFLEPGTALVADTMKFVVKVISTKNVRNKCIAIVSGSKFNISPTSDTINLPIKVYRQCRKNIANKQKTIDIAGYTCIENDYLYKKYKGNLEIGDYIVFNNVGSYSLVMKPPFILPNCAAIEHSPKKGYNIIKRQENLKDIFNTFRF
ncbi:MAG: decarboxylase [Patescibacteria group bacterium]|nr:decarboxylase [Patescibacteria group bacterium]